MPEYLKQSKPEAERAADDVKVRSIVESTLGEIQTRGDAAVRALSEKFDGYRPENFRLSAAEIEALIAQLSPREILDIQFAQAQVRNFAQAQRDSMRDIEVETMPGVILGHKNIPVQNQVVVNVAARQAPMHIFAKRSGEPDVNERAIAVIHHFHSVVCGHVNRLVRSDRGAQSEAGLDGP